MTKTEAAEIIANDVDRGRVLMNKPTASYRADGRRFRAVIRYPDGHTRTANGRAKYYTAADARVAAQQVIDTEAEIYGDGVVYEPEYSDEQRG